MASALEKVLACVRGLSPSAEADVRERRRVSALASIENTSWNGWKRTAASQPGVLPVAACTVELTLRCARFVLVIGPGPPGSCQRRCRRTNEPSHTISSSLSITDLKAAVLRIADGERGVSLKNGHDDVVPRRGIKYH